MKQNRRYVASAQSAHVLRWILRQGNAAISCGIDVRPDRSFDLAVIPSWSRTPVLLEHFPSAIAAMERHAEVTDRLRGEGWS